MEKREKANRKENKNVLTGSVKAVESIGKGIFNGLTGNFTFYISFFLTISLIEYRRD